MSRSHASAGLLAALLLSAAVGSAHAEDTAPVTREEFNKMAQEMQQLRNEVAELKKERDAAAAATQPATQNTAQSAEVQQLRQEVATLKQQRTEDQTDAEERAQEIEKVVNDAIKVARENAGGEQTLLITGDASVGFTAQKNSPSTFEAGVAPRFIWKVDDRLAFDAAFDFGIGRDDSGNNATSADLTIASATYTLNDYLVVGGGLFVAPFAAYHSYFDPPWINKLPDDPLVFSDGGIAPSSLLGAYLSGAYPIGGPAFFNHSKINYALYVSNGPSLVVNDPSNAGSLDLLNSQDLNSGKGVGGRVGYLPVPELEVGYSFLWGDSAPNGFPHTDSFLQALDLNYTRRIDALLGNVTFRSEWVWSHTSNATYGPTASPPFNSLTFNNDRNGGYFMFAYRPSLSSIKFIRNFEGVIRYDRMDASNAAPSGGGHEQRLALGLDYWIDPRAVAKVAYEFDDKSSGDSAPAFMLQFGLGF